MLGSLFDVAANRQHFDAGNGASGWWFHVSIVGAAKKARESPTNATKTTTIAIDRCSIIQVFAGSIQLRHDKPSLLGAPLWCCPNFLDLSCRSSWRIAQNMHGLAQHTLETWMTRTKDTST